MNTLMAYKFFYMIPSNYPSILEFLRSHQDAPFGNSLDVIQQKMENGLYNEPRLFLDAIDAMFNLFQKRNNIKLDSLRQGLQQHIEQLEMAQQRLKTEQIVPLLDEKKKRKNQEEFHVPIRQCGYCCTRSTPMWRHGPIDYDPLCNSCGVKWKRGRILKGIQEFKTPKIKITFSMECSKLMPYHKYKKEQQPPPSTLMCPTKRAQYLSKHIKSMPLPQLATVLLSLPPSVMSALSDAMAMGQDGELDVRDIKTSEWVELVRVVEGHKIV